MASRQHYPNFAATDATHEKGGNPVRKPPKIQDFAMLNIADKAAPHKGDAPSIKGFNVVSEDRRAFEWLAEQVNLCQRGIVSQTITLTPALARTLLAANPENRRISDSFVENYARDIENGAWHLNGEPVIVSREGLLNDGQHRCEAVIRANKSIDVVIVIGAERETRLTLDQGRARMTADYLSMNGHHDGHALAATAGFVWQYLRAGSVSRNHKYRPTKGEILAIIEERPSITESLNSIKAKGSDGAGGRSCLAFCHWAIRQKAPAEDVAAFFASLIGGANLLARDPILYPRNRIMVERTRLRPNQKAELIFRAWNAHRRGEFPKTLPILDGGLPTLER